MKSASFPRPMPRLPAPGQLVRWRHPEHVRLFGDISATYEEGGQLDTRILGLPVIPPSVPGGTVLPPILIPPSGDFLSVTGREYSLSAHAGGTFALSPRDNASLSCPSAQDVTVTSVPIGV